MFIINEWRTVLLLYLIPSMVVPSPYYTGDPYDHYRGHLGTPEEVQPQVIFREEGQVSASLSFGHLTIDVDIAHANELAEGITSLLNSAKKLLQQPFGNNEEHAAAGAAWTHAAWNRTEARFLHAHTNYQQTLQLFFHGLTDNSIPAQTANSFLRSSRPVVGKIVDPVDQTTTRTTRASSINGPLRTPATTSKPPQKVDKDPFGNHALFFDQLPMLTYNLSSTAHKSLNDATARYMNRITSKSSKHSSVGRFSDFSLPNVKPYTPSETAPTSDSNVPATADTPLRGSYPNSTASGILPHDRHKRFAVTTGVLLIGGLVTLINSAISISNVAKIAGINAGSVSKEQAQFIVKTLQSHETLVKELESELGTVSTEIEILRLRGYQNTAAIQSTLQHSRALETVNLVIDEYARVVAAISHGLRQLLDGKLTTDLIPPTTMIPLIAQLKEKATKADLDTPVTDVASVYGLGCSFVAKAPTKVTVIVHLPVTRPNSLMTLYRFLDLGYAIPHSNLSVNIDVEAPLLAVNKDRTGFLMLNSVDECLDLGTIKMCSGHNFLLRSFKSYCISSLFIGRTNDAENVCSMNILPAQARVVQHSRTNYYVFHPVLKTLAIDQCRNDSHNRKITFRGTQLIKLQSRCFGHTDDYQLSPLEELGMQLQGTVTFKNPLSLPKLLRGVPIKTLEELYPKPPPKITKVEDIADQYRRLAKAANPFAFSWPFHFPAIASSTLIFIFGILFVLAYCFCKERLPCFKASAVTGTPVSVNVNPGNHQAHNGFEAIPLNDPPILPPNYNRSRRNSVESVGAAARRGAANVASAFEKARDSVNNLHLFGTGRDQRRGQSGSADNSDYGSEMINMGRPQ
jgi:hypothetical protein